MFLYVKNGSGSSISVTIVTPVVINGLALADQIIAIPANSEKIMGLFTPQVYNDQNDFVNISFTSITSVTVVAFRTQ